MLGAVRQAVTRHTAGDARRTLAQGCAARWRRSVGQVTAPDAGAGDKLSLCASRIVFCQRRYWVERDDTARHMYYLDEDEE